MTSDSTDGRANEEDQHGTGRPALERAEGHEVDAAMPADISERLKLVRNVGDGDRETFLTRHSQG